MTRVLVTGGAGFIGSFLTDSLVEKGYKVTVFDNLEPQVHPGGRIPDYFNKKAKFVYGDVLDYKALRKVVKGQDYIFHFAGRVGVAQSQYEIKKYTDVNVGGTANLLDILVNTKIKIKKLIIAASMSSYGEGVYKCPKCGEFRPGLRNIKQCEKKKWEIMCPDCLSFAKPVPTPESAGQNCNSIYALTKKVQEDMGTMIGKTYNIPTTALRFFNVYGPRQSLSNPYTGVVAIFLSRIKNDRSPVIFEDGVQTRDFIYVDDVIRACISVMTSSSANYEVFNVGNGKPLTLIEVSEKIAKSCGKNIKPEITNKFRKGDVRHCYADMSKIKEMIGFKPEVSFEDGIKKLIDWSKEVKAIDRYERVRKEMKARGLV